MKRLSLSISAFFGGLAGALFAIYLGFISTDIVFGLNLDFLPLVASLLGGMGVFLGPLWGAFILTLADLNLPAFIHGLFPSVTVGPLVVSGTILLVVGLFLPAGIMNAGVLSRYASVRPDELFLRAFRRPRAS
jgi:branched-chain amino acid transport system permease protein